MSNPSPSTSQSNAGVKRRRTSESSEPRQGEASGSGGVNTNSFEFTRIKREGDRSNSPSEPPTDRSEDEGVGNERTSRSERGLPLSRREWVEGGFAMSWPEEDGHEDGEPDTEEEGEEEEAMLVGNRLLQRGEVVGGSAGNGNLNVPERQPQASTPTLDLTDDGDDDDDIIAVAGPSSFRPAKPKPEADDEVEIVAVPSTYDSTSTASKDRKGKGRAVPTPSPSTQPPSSFEPLPSFSTLSCPICLGPPTPLALTSCGHAFCAPCLHAALVAGPALTPPPPGTSTSTATTNGRGGGGGGNATSTRGRGRLPAGSGWRGGVLGGGGSGVSPRSRLPTSGRGGGQAGPTATATDDEETGDPDLNKHCPVCRTPLYGGWGKSLRGLVVRMAPVKPQRVAEESPGEPLVV